MVLCRSTCCDCWQCYLGKAGAQAATRQTLESNNQIFYHGQSKSAIGLKPNHFELRDSLLHKLYSRGTAYSVRIPVFETSLYFRLTLGISAKKQIDAVTRRISYEVEREKRAGGVIQD